MNDAGLEVAQREQVSTAKVPLNPETAPPGTYFIASTSGRIYQVMEWLNPDQRQFKIRSWKTGADLSFVRSHPEPDKENCLDLAHQYAEGTEVYVIGPEPVALSEPHFLWGDPAELEETGAEVEEQVAEEEAVAEAVEEWEEAEVEQQPEPEPEGNSPAEVLGAVSEEQEEKMKLRLHGLRLEEVPEGFLAKLPRTWRNKMDWLRDILALCQEYQFKAHIYQITEWAIRLGVWEDFDKGKGNVRSNIVELTKNEGGFRIKSNRLLPPEPHPDKPKPVPGVKLQEKLAATASTEELSEDVIRQRLGIGVLEGAALLLVCPLRKLTPELVETLRELLED